MVEIAEDFKIKDSGAREQFESGMHRDVEDGKIKWLLVRSGPMLKRWAAHLTGGAEKYGDDNWMLASGQPELDRFRASAARHFEQWLDGDRDEDHGAAVFFNINGAEYVRDKMQREVRYVDDRPKIRVVLVGRMSPFEHDSPYPGGGG